MQFAVDYNNCPKIRDKVDEIKLNYIKNFTSLKNFLENHKQQRVCFYIDENNFNPEEDCTLISMLRQNNPEYNFFFLLPLGHEDWASKLKEFNLPFSIKIYLQEWDLLNYYINLGVSDIFIINNLGFELDKVAKVAHAHKVRVRAFPNIAQSNARNSAAAYKKFFIRPEDLEYYNPYVDVCEFFGNKEEVYYKIYHDDKKWYGRLNEIIYELDDDIDNRSIPQEDFCTARIHCGKKCIKGGNCHVCDSIINFARTLQERHLMFMPKN